MYVNDSMDVFAVLDDQDPIKFESSYYKSGACGC